MTRLALLALVGTFALAQPARADEAWSPSRYAMEFDETGACTATFDGEPFAWGLGDEQFCAAAIAERLGRDRLARYREDGPQLDRIEAMLCALGDRTRRFGESDPRSAAAFEGCAP